MKLKRKKVTLYKYSSVNYLIENISNKRLLMGDWKSFNDPFEQVVINHETREISHIDGLHILCLTNSFRNKLMWSHYSDSHKGVCLAVSVPIDLVYPMCYTSKRIYDNSNIDELIKTSKFASKSNLVKSYDNLSNNKKITYLKDKKWIYEKEYRIVLGNNNDVDMVYDSSKNLWFAHVDIQRIYLGVNFFENSDCIIRKLKEICEKFKIEVRVMKLSNDNYSINPMKKSERIEW